MATGNDTQVDTALLLSTAETLDPMIKKLETIFDQIQQEVKSQRSDWQGDTSDDIKNTAAALKNSSAEMIRVLNSYVTGLKELAGIYDKAESNVSNKGKSLKFNNTFK